MPVEEGDCHVRYALRVGPDKKGAPFVGHSGGCLGTLTDVPFSGARIWVKRGDAKRYMDHRNVEHVRKKLELIEVTCAVGKPFAIYTEK